MNVNEASDLEDDEFADSLDQPDVSVYDPNTFCISQRSFAIGIAIAGLILMSAVVVAIMILVSKRRRKNLSTTGSSIYSGPYTNTAYSHSSMSRFASPSGFSSYIDKAMFIIDVFQAELRVGCLG